MLYSADLVPTTSHVSLPYIMAYDISPLKTVAEKEKYLQLATEQKQLAPVFPTRSDNSCRLRDKKPKRLSSMST